jgi:hypothetical protein
MEKITVDELQEKCRALFEKRKAYEDSKAITAKLNADYEQSEREIIEILQALEMKTFTSNYGVISLRKKEYYPIPKSPEQKEAIRKYMEEKGIFEQYWSIHSQSFNSWVKQEKEVAIEEKRFLNLPGVEAPTISFDLAMKKTNP